MSKGKQPGKLPPTRVQQSTGPRGRVQAKPVTDPAKLMRLEAGLRAQPTASDLTFHSVNALAQFFEAEQAIAFSKRGTIVTAIAASNVPSPNPDSSWVQHVKRVVEKVAFQTPNLPERVSLQRETSDQPVAHPFGVLIALPDTPHKSPDNILLARSRGWKDEEMALAGYLGTVYAHAFQRRLAKRITWNRRLVRFVLWGALAALIAAMIFVKVPSFAVAPARVVASVSNAVAPAVSGTVETVYVIAGEDVSKGALLVQLDTRVADAELASARQDLIAQQIKEAQLRNLALRQPQARSELLLADADVALALLEVERAELSLDLHSLKAPADGRVIGERLDRLVGQPVEFGDVLFTIADPSAVHIAADIPLSDSNFVYGAESVRFFPNDNPFNPLPLDVHSAPILPAVDARGSVSYPMELTFSDATSALTIGAEGIVQLTGQDARLGFVLFRKPFTWLLQRLPYGLVAPFIKPAGQRARSDG